MTLLISLRKWLCLSIHILSAFTERIVIEVLILLLLLESIVVLILSICYLLILPFAVIWVIKFCLAALLEIFIVPTFYI